MHSIMEGFVTKKNDSKLIGYLAMIVRREVEHGE